MFHKVCNIQISIIYNYKGLCWIIKKNINMLLLKIYSIIVLTRISFSIILLSLIFFSASGWHSWGGPARIWHVLLDVSDESRLYALQKTVTKTYRQVKYGMHDSVCIIKTTVCCSVFSGINPYSSWYAKCNSYTEFCCNDIVSIRGDVILQ